ncbi:hypothetical protein H4582DRAFT_1946990 [Lactarius indigo]|nr:hypothetical protein H4582DRAFT_1946990 [Lactarius indigo]
MEHQQATLNSCVKGHLTCSSPVIDPLLQPRSSRIGKIWTTVCPSSLYFVAMSDADPYLDSAQITDPQGRQPQLVCVEVAVLQAHNIPHIKNRFGGKTRFYVTIAHNTTTRKTEGVQIEGQTAQWDQKLDAFFVQPPSSHLILCLYAKSLARRDILIGKCEIPVEPQINVPFVLSNGDGQVGQSMQAVTLYLTITVSTGEFIPTLATDLVVKQAPLNPCTCILNGCILCLSVLGSVVF